MGRLLIIEQDHNKSTAVTPRLHSLCKERRIVIDAADCAASGVLLAYTHEYNAIFLNLGMPGRLGFTFIEQLHRIRPHARIVVIGAINSQRDKEYACARDGIQWVSHASDLDQLRAIVTSLYSMRPARNHRRRGSLVGVSLSGGTAPSRRA